MQHSEKYNNFLFMIELDAADCAAVRKNRVFRGQQEHA